MENQPQPDAADKFRKSYSMSFKLSVVQFAERNSKSKAARTFRVSRSRVQQWVSQKQDLLTQTPSGKRIRGGGRKVKDDALDRRILAYITENRSKQLRVTRTMIRRFAKSIGDHTFRASNGWLEKFLNRHSLSNRRPTTVCQKPPSEYERQIISFILHITRLRQNERYQHIFAADETAVFLDSSNSCTVSERGAKDVPVLSTGHNKARITVMLTARSDGRKCKPFVLLNRKRVDKQIVNEFKNELELCWEGTTWMNDITTSMYLRRVFGASLFGKTLLIWDSFRSHTSEHTKKTLKELHFDSAVVPGGCTKFIQAPDVSWNSPFKAKIRHSYEEWMMEEGRPLTKGGNPAAPPMKTYLKWIADAWKDLPEGLIEKSFKNCGITTACDGSEDEQIVCFRPDGPIPTGMQRLAGARSANGQIISCDQEEQEFDEDDLSAVFNYCDVQGDVE